MQLVSVNKETGRWGEMNKIQIVITVLATLGSILVILGYLIKFQNRIQLVAGVYKNEDKITDKKGFASIVGGNLLVLGIIFCSGALGIYACPGCKEIIEPILLLCLLVIGIIIYVKSRKYIASTMQDAPPGQSGGVR